MTSSCCYDQYSAFIETVSIHLVTFQKQPQRCSVKKVFLEILKNSQENTCASDSFLIKLQASCSCFLKQSPLKLNVASDLWKTGYSL